MILYCNVTRQHLRSSFAPRGLLCLEDIPKTFPIFNKKTGNISRFSRGKRIVSMPFLHGVNKELPQLPLQSTEAETKNIGKRSISMFPQPKLIQH